MLTADLVFELAVFLTVFLVLLAIPHKQRHAHVRSIHRHTGLRHVKPAA